MPLRARVRDEPSRESQSDTKQPMDTQVSHQVDLCANLQFWTRKLHLAGG